MLSSFVSTLFFENLVGNVQQFKNLSDKIGASELTQQFLKKGFKMCGIVGAVGHSCCSSALLDALKRLEYRGYDSSGIVTIHCGEINLRRSVGKLVNLEKALKKSPLAGDVGIGHTRWATHGGISTENAHPHVASGRVAIVHNGIIENHRLIRSRLESEGRQFTSDTDSEVLAHLFVEAIDEGLELTEATQKVIAELEGAYAFAALLLDCPDTLVVARNASPLAIGIGKNCNYVGSDAIALSNLTQRITYLKDKDFALVKADKILIYQEDGKPANREEVIVSLYPGLVDKGGYRHFMEKEIHEQPDAIAHSLAAMTDDSGRLTVQMDVDELKSINGIVMIAAGTSHYASQVARYWIESIANVPVSCDLASEYHYRSPAVGAFTTAMAISQSGESLDTLMAMRRATANGMKVIAVVNVPQSTIARESDTMIPTRAGPEIGVASTKAFTAQLTVLICFAVALARAKGKLDEAASARIQEQIQSLPGIVGKSLNLFDVIRPIAQELANARSTLYLGRGVLFPLALEGALKLKELSYIHAEGFASGEMKHGPIALIEDNLPVVALLASDATLKKAVSNLREASARGARIILIAEERVINEVDFASRVVSLPNIHSFLSPILFAVPAQILAYLTAVEKGTDVDQPRNLAKSVTVE